MTDLKFLRRGRKPAHGFLKHTLRIALFSLLMPLSHAADDPYLQMLDEEVTKVDGVATDTGNDGASAPAAAGRSQRKLPMPSREHFETLLREQHVGTYSFYRKLPERIREEVFLDYSNGASMESLRKKIIDRFLHP